jgi:hypothetical protein
MAVERSRAVAEAGSSEQQRAAQGASKNESSIPAVESDRYHCLWLSACVPHLDWTHGFVARQMQRIGRPLFLQYSFGLLVSTGASY